MAFIFQHSLPCGPHASSIGVCSAWILWYRSSHPDPREKKGSSTADMTSSLVRYCFPAKCCFVVVVVVVVAVVMLGPENSQIVPNQENMEGDQPVQCLSHALQPLQPHTCVQEHYPGETGLLSSVFQPSPEMSLYYISSPESLIQCTLSGRNKMQLVSGKVEFNGCQASLLWHNSFIVNL